MCLVGAKHVLKYCQLKSALMSKSGTRDETVGWELNKVKNRSEGWRNGANVKRREGDHPWCVIRGL